MLKKSQRNVYSLLLCVAALCFAQAVRADDPLFPADPALATPLSVQLNVPLRQLGRLKPDETEEFAGELVMDNGTAFPVVVSPRGKSRREHCKVPPLWLDFKKKELKGTVFAKQNKLKLVTHCTRKFASKEYLASEMLVYRLFNLFTDKSFRVRALQIEYVDGDRTESRHGFLIEHKKRLAKRLDVEPFDPANLSIDQPEPVQATVIALFNLMIGNTDFSVIHGVGGVCCHNAEPFLLAPGAGRHEVLPVPYDFDASGIVNPPYANPAPNVGIKRVTQRRYRGYCKHNDEIEGVVEQFQANKDEIFALVNSFDDIPGLRTERVVKYLAGFYEIIDSPKQREKKLNGRCR